MMGIESQYPFQLIESWRNAFLATKPGFGPKKNTALTGGRSFTIEDAIETAYMHLHNGRSGLH